MEVKISESKSSAGICPSRHSRTSQEKLERRKTKRKKVKLFSVVPSKRTRGKGHRLKHGKFWLNTRKDFTVSVTEHWNRLSRESALEGIGLDDFQRSLPTSTTP